MRRILLFLWLAPVLCGQAMVEYGVNAGRAGVSGMGARRVGKSAGEALKKADPQRFPTYDPKKPLPAGTLRTAPDAAQGAAASPPPGGPGNPAIDPAAIQLGLDREELVRRFGKPSAKITQQQGSDLIEKCWYRAAGYDPVVVTLKNGKVAAVSN